MLIRKEFINIDGKQISEKNDEKRKKKKDGRKREKENARNSQTENDWKTSHNNFGDRFFHFTSFQTIVHPEIEQVFVCCVLY